MADPVFRAEGVSKHYGGVVALFPTDIDVHKGEILVLAGANGAGKTTLVKIICGAEPSDTGIIRFDGEEVATWDIFEARRRGVEVAHQELALVSQISPVENLFLGREETFHFLPFLARRRMVADARRLLRSLGIELANLRAKTEELSGGQRQAIALARVVGWGKRMAILDEPTAALGLAESARVQSLIASLRDKGLAVVVVSHRLDQIVGFADRVVVLRNGRVVGCLEGTAIKAAPLAELITGEHSTDVA